jgi:pyrimidine-nucleoside phosphorylase
MASAAPLRRGRPSGARAGSERERAGRPREVADPPYPARAALRREVHGAIRRHGGCNPAGKPQVVHRRQESAFGGAGRLCNLQAARRGATFTLNISGTLPCMESMYGIIRKKRNGERLSREELHTVVQGYVAGSIPDYQVAALLMAIFFRGMSPQETTDLTLEMVRSGDQVDLSTLPNLPVDKHSTGGVGDKTTLVLAPMLAAAGCTVAKMSGRGLGHTGGTLDKLEAIPGFSTDLSAERLVTQARAVGLAIAAQGDRLVPADGRLYALRDVTATVDSLPLIASSIMSKKLAAGARAIVLDVKSGSGAFMRQPDDAFALARAMVDIATHAGRTAVALVTDMEQPLGAAIGNSVEVREAIAVLSGAGPADVRELCLLLGANLLAVALPGHSLERARALLVQTLESGAALERFRRLVQAQGGDPTVVDNPDGVLPQARLHEALLAPADGYITAIDALTIGEAARDLGAGRQQKGDRIDLAAGIELQQKVGGRVRRGEPWALLHASDRERLRAGTERAATALRLGPAPPTARPVLHGTVLPEARPAHHEVP